MTERTFTRRHFLGRTSSCAAHVAFMASAAPAWARIGWLVQERFPVDAAEAWGRLLRIREGIWALVSDPLRDRTTLCNGGIVAGRAGVVVVEGFATTAGSSWMAEQARRLTGRAPTHVVLTHYHSDHTAGLAGVAGGRDVEVLTTEVTRDLVRERVRGPSPQIVTDIVTLRGRRPTEIDLGDRSVILVPRRGHTPSDVTVEVPEESVVFCGDLVWNHMFPNYVDAAPRRLSEEVRIMRLLDTETYVPGHGPLADAAAVDTYVRLLDDVEGAARSALERGMSAEEAGATYRLPPGLEEWTLFDPGYFARAIGSWMEELRG